MSQLIVNIEDASLLSQLKKAISLLKGVSKVQVKRTTDTLNKKTIKAIKSAEDGDTIKCDSFGEYLKKSY